MWSVIIPFVLYYLFAFAVCYLVTESGQNYLYDEVTPAIGLKTAGGAFLLAVLMTWARAPVSELVTTKMYLVILLAVAGFLVFVLVFQFQPTHGALIGIISTLLIALLAGLAIDSLTVSRQRARTEYRPPTPPIRRPVPGARPPATPEPAQTEAPKD